jgi:acid phosphatase
MFQRSSRRFLAALFACSVGGAALWAIDTRAAESDADGPTTVEDARPYPAYRAPAFASGRPTLAFLAAGDTGWPGPMLDSVATAMDRVGSELPFSFVCLLGDNFYRNGVRSEVDGLWRTVFEDEFRGPHLCVPFHCALGNHDHNGNVQAQVEYSTRSTRWNMPGQYYTFVEPAGGDREAQFFVLDTEELRRDDGASAEQRLWLEDKLSRSTARWKIVMGHHPARSNGVHGSTSALRKSLEPLFERYGVALYLSGHDHDLELLETGRGYLQVVSGAGSKPRSMRWGDDTLFASAAPGFVWVGIEKDELWLVFVDAARGPVFSRCFERPELVACLTGGR